jgi:hypothetical protein
MIMKPTFHHTSFFNAGLLRVFMLIALATRPVLSVSAAPENERALAGLGAREGAFRFIVIGDNRPGGDPVRQPAAFRRIIDEINRLDPDFVVNNGDLIQGYTGDTAVLAAMWDAYIEQLDRCRVPVISVVGNHDVWGPDSDRMYRDRIGDLTFSFDYGGCHFIGLNTEDFAGGGIDRIAGEQLAWLKADLRKARDADHIFVFLHRPLWIQAGADTAGRYSYQSNWMDDVHPLLVEHGVRAVMAGHEHLYRDEGVIDGIQYVIVGGAGAPLHGRGLAEGGFYHLVQVSVRDKAATYAVLESGHVHPKDVTARATARRAAGLREQIRDSVPSWPVTVNRAGGPYAGELVLTNMFDAAVGVALTWSIAPEADWSVSTGTPRVTVPAGAVARLPYALSYGGGAMQPLPELVVEVRDGKALLFEFRGEIGIAAPAAD